MSANTPARTSARPPTTGSATSSRRAFLRAGAAAGAGTVVGVGLFSHAAPAAAAVGASVVQTTQVVVVDSADEIPAGTPAGTLVVVRS